MVRLEIWFFGRMIIEIKCHFYYIISGNSSAILTLTTGSQVILHWLKAQCPQDSLTSDTTLSSRAPRSPFLLTIWLQIWGYTLLFVRMIHKTQTLYLLSQFYYKDIKSGSVKRRDPLGLLWRPKREISMSLGHIPLQAHWHVSPTKKFTWAGSRVFIEVLLQRHNWLNN